MTTPHNHHHPDRDHAGHAPAGASGSLRCPECGAAARIVPPRDWPLDAIASRPVASHRDGTPVCAVPGPGGSRPADPVGVPARLTMWQAVRQSWLIHPDWTVADHLAWLDGEGLDTGALTGDPAEVIDRWLTEHRRTAPTAPMVRPADEARVYVVAGGDMVAVFDSVEAADLMAVTMAFASLDPVTRCLTEAQWQQARAVLRSQQPHVTVTDARPGRAAGAS
ncbi:hypothetical protein O7627_11770 [Solwaraspora sp. WMMD1047]|uniref:hypothetical protein n=1 Tax=Solwaraspora sp. WMMD1047 TaxID=3016102 RepID=UPI002417FC54|nr:hypothetical protein [Solwaraspora sp. WMMD1047]MDG4829976.1 hypothetical protein [Solwaraspora sp. WMMD1047]